MCLFGTKWMWDLMGQKTWSTISTFCKVPSTNCSATTVHSGEIMDLLGFLTELWREVMTGLHVTIKKLHEEVSTIHADKLFIVP